MRQKSGQVVVVVAAVAGALDKHTEGLGRALEREHARTATLAQPRLHTHLLSLSAAQQQTSLR